MDEKPTEGRVEGGELSIVVKVLTDDTRIWDSRWTAERDGDGTQIEKVPRNCIRS
jgi:hypothetical protein